MKLSYQNGEQYFHKLYIRFNAYIAVSLLPMAWLLLEKQTNQLIPIPLTNLLYWLVIGSIFLGTASLIYFSMRQFKTVKSTASKEKTLRAKLDLYYVASMKKYFDFLLAGLLSVAGMWITGNTLFLVSYIVSLIFLSLGRPTISTFIEDLNLSEDEQTILLEKQPIE